MSDRRPSEGAEVQRRTVRVAAKTVPGGWVVGGATRLLDVWSPSLLVSRASAFAYPDHELRFTLGSDASSPRGAAEGGGLRRRLKRLQDGSSEAITVDEPSIYFDARHDATSNVAHALQNQIAVALLGLDAFDLADRADDLVFVVHSDCPDYILELYRLLGFRTIATSFGTIHGTRLQMAPLKMPYRAGACAPLRRRALARGVLEPDMAPTEPLYLARRNRRALENGEAIEPLIRDAGYRTIYAEDLPVREQIRTIATASAVVALHGAAMSHLMFRDPAQGAPIVECVPCGYASNWARAIGHETGCTWLGVQEALDGTVLASLDQDGHPRDFEGRNYALDPASVRVALEMVDVSRRDDIPLSDARMLACVPDVAVTPKRPDA